MLQLLKKNITNKLKINRTQLELLEMFKLLEDLLMIHQKFQCTILNSLNKKSQKMLKLKLKPQMRAERSSSNTSKWPQTSSKLKILKRTPEPSKLPKWTSKTSRILSMRKPESDPEELP